MVSFAIQKLVHWLGGHLFIFAFISTVWETDPRKHWHALCQRMFCLCSLLGLLWYHVLHFSLFKLFCVNSGDLDSVWSTSWSCRLVWLFNTPVPLGCPHAASPSPLLGCVGWSLSFSPCPLRMSTRVSCAGECSKVARTIWATWFCLPQVGGCTLPWASEAPYLSQLISQPVKGAPRFTKHFNSLYFFCATAFVWNTLLTLSTWQAQAYNHHNHHFICILVKSSYIDASFLFPRDIYFYETAYNTLILAFMYSIFTTRWESSWCQGLCLTHLLFPGT